MMNKDELPEEVRWITYDVKNREALLYYGLAPNVKIVKDVLAIEIIDEVEPKESRGIYIRESSPNMVRIEPTFLVPEKVFAGCKREGFVITCKLKKKV
ncbi:MAG: hypothetical protein ACTSWZ_07695 [Candidatus Heimdallarchaeaceae archaeon]